MANTSDSSRVVFLDWMRFLACFLVMLTHSVEPFYLGGQGTLVQTQSDALWVTGIDSALRVCIGLFVMASSYLLVPLKYDAGTFFRKRFVRVLIPFVIWSLLYACFFPYGKDGAGVVASLRQLVFNLDMNAGHLWFVYMLLGVYLVMPILSPWLERATKREEQVVLVVWLVTTFVPFLRKAAAALTGSSELWGEANWNEFGTLYYVSGFLGYVVLGHYFKTYVGALSRKKTLALALPLWLLGYAISFSWFWSRIPSTYPVEGPIDLAVDWEQSWRFCSTGVVMQCVAVFLLLRRITASGALYRCIVLPVSKASYGMYLMHMFFLLAVFPWYNSLCTPLHMVACALTTYLFSALTALLIQRIPKVGKYLAG